jgi:hypothetical protein
VAARTFTDVKLVAEHLPETHRTLENDRTVTTAELPGTVMVYLVIDGGRVPLTQLRGGDVLEAIDKAGEQQRAAEQSRQQAATEQQSAPATSELQQAAPAAPEQPQG